MSDNAKSPVLGYEEIADRLIPAEPRISPDGRHVAFTVSTANKTKEGKKRAIWLSRDRQPAIRFTGGDANNRDPRWSPDGTKLVFVANRHDPEKDGLYLLPVDGGEAQRLGDLEGSLSDPTWSPDGKLIAVLRTDPETEAEKKKREEQDDPVIYEEELKKTRLWIVDPEKGTARQLTYGDESVWGYSWAPDGDRILVNTTTVPVINEVIRGTTLWHVAVTGGVMRRIATYPGGAGSSLIAEIDGEQVAVSIASDGRADPAASIWTVPLGGGDPQNRTPGLKGSFYHLEPDPADRGQVIAKFDEGLHQRLVRVQLATGTVTPITPPSLAESGTVTGDPSLSADGSAVAVIWESTDSPREIFVGDLNGEPGRVTEFGKTFAGRLLPGERVAWKSTDGVEIEGLLIKPAGFAEGTPVPLIVEIHGGPTWQWEDRVMLDWHDWAQMLASRGYAVLLPNPRGSAGYGSDFEKLLISDVGGGETQDIISGAMAMVAKGVADPERLGLGGWSWGGFLTASTIVQTDIFKAAVMGAGVANLISDHAAGDIPQANLAYYPGHPYTHWDLYAKGSPIRLAANAKTPTLILHGDSDIRVHPTQGQEFYRALKEQGVPVQFVRYPREGHGFQERNHQIDLMRRIVEWYERWIPVR